LIPARVPAARIAVGQATCMWSTSRMIGRKQAKNRPN